MRSQILQVEELAPLLVENPKLMAAAKLNYRDLLPILLKSYRPEYLAMSMEVFERMMEFLSGTPFYNERIHGAGFMEQLINPSAYQVYARLHSIVGYGRVLGTRWVGEYAIEFRYQ